MKGKQVAIGSLLVLLTDSLKSHMALDKNYAQ